MKRTKDKSSRLPDLTRPELIILKLLWRQRRLAAREIHEEIGGKFSWAYSTTRTTLERMVKKGLLDKQEFHGLNVYAAGISRARGLAALVRDFAESVLETDYAPVVSLFADAKTLDPDELAELRTLLGDEKSPGGEEKDSTEEDSAWGKFP